MVPPGNSQAEQKMTSPYFKGIWQRGFGTFPLKGDVLKEALITALDIGYRAIDTAQMYQNESDIGKVLAHAGLPREELLITSKVPNSNFTQDTFIPSVEQSLTELQIDQLDVLLVHWPPADGEIAHSIDLLREAKQRSLAKHIGVSNFTAAMLRQVADIDEEEFVTNQVEFHPLLDQSVLLQASNETGIPLSSYCSVARGKVFSYSLFDELAEQYDVTAAQVVLRWILQKGVNVNAMSTKRANLEANFDIMTFSLSNVDMNRIDQLGKHALRIVDETLVPWAPDWD